MANKHYEVVAKLGEDGRRELFLARVATASVVLARLRPALARDLATVRTFLDEARVAAPLSHPNIAKVLDVGQLGSSYYVAMEHVDGESVRAAVDHAKATGRGLQMPLRAVLTIAAGIAAGLHHAHEDDDTVHGTLSPANVVIGRDGIVKLVGFGMSSAASDEAEVGYSSPEQVRGEPIDRRSDLFSVGVVLWELLVREPLFRRATRADTIKAIEHEPAITPSKVRLDVPHELDEIILKLLAKTPSSRYVDADELLVDVEALATKLGFQLSTTDLARLVRLWFGAKPDLSPLQAAVVVDAEDLPDQLVTPLPASPIDALLDSVRSLSEVIPAVAAVLDDQRSARTTMLPTGDEPRETFEQIRDRILGARGDKDAKSPRAKAYTRPLISTTDTSLAMYDQYAMSPTAITDVIARVTQSSAAAGAATRATIAAKAPVAETPTSEPVIAPVASNGEPVAGAPEPEPAPVAAAPELAPAREPAAVAAAAEPESATAAAASEPESAKAPVAAASETEPATAKPEAPAIALARTQSNSDRSSSGIALARTQSAEWFERGEREAHEAHARHAHDHHDDDHDDHPPPRAPRADAAVRRPAWLVPGLGAAVVLVVIAIVAIAIRKPEPGARADRVAVQIADASEAAVAPVPDAAEAAMAAPVEAEPVVVAAADAAQLAAPPDAAQLAVAPAVVPIDAAPKVAAVPIDAAPKVAAIPIDATQVVRVTPEHAKPPKRTEPEAAPEPAASIEQLSADGNFAKANQACAKNTQFDPARLETCAIVACHVKDTALAARWIRAIARAERDGTIAKCNDLGVEIAPP